MYLTRVKSKNGKQNLSQHSPAQHRTEAIPVLTGCTANKQIQVLHVSLNEEGEKLSLDMKHPPTKEQLRQKKLILFQPS